MFTLIFESLASVVEVILQLSFEFILEFPDKVIEKFKEKRGDEEEH